MPDVSLYSSAGLPGYLFCSSDQSNWNTTDSYPATGSCNSDFFVDSTSQDLAAQGGHQLPFANFAGMIALINQMQDWPGRGLANPMLYTLAAGANSSTLFTT